MLISLKKNKWLYDWMTDNYGDELYSIVSGIDHNVPRPNKIYDGVAKLLSSKGYKSKMTNNGDIIISMTEEEYIFLKLKYC